MSSTLYDLEDDEAEDATDIMAGDFFGSIKSKGKKGRKNVAKVPARKAPARAAEEDEDDYYNDEGEGINMDADSNEEDDNEGVCIPIVAPFVAPHRSLRLRRLGRERR